MTNYKFKLFYILGTCFTFFGCKHDVVSLNTPGIEHSFNISAFPQKTNLEFKSLTPFKGIATDLLVIDTFLIINHQYGNYFINVFSKNTGVLINKALPASREPNGVLGSFQIGKQNDSFYSFELETNKIRFIKLNELFYKKTQSFRTIQLDKSINSIIPISKNFVGTGNSDSRQKFIFFDKSGHKQYSAGSYYKFPSNKDDMFFYQGMFVSNLCVKPDQSRFVTSYRHTDVIEIYDAQGKSIKSIHGPDNFTPQPTTPSAKGNFVFNNDTKMAYLYTKGTDKYIYALYSGKTVDQPYANSGSIILVFDWNGNPIKTYSFNDRFYAFGIDELNKRFYAVSLKSKNIIFAQYEE